MKWFVFRPRGPWAGLLFWLIVGVVYLVYLVLACRAFADYQPAFVAAGCPSGQGQCVIIPNASSTGTVNNGLAKLTSAPSTAVETATTDTQGAIGVVQSGAGTSGNALIEVEGLTNCVFDGATTAGDYVGISGTTAGDCKDLGSTVASTVNQQCLGIVQSTNGAGGTFQMLFGRGCPTADYMQFLAGNGTGSACTATTNGNNTFASTATCGATEAQVQMEMPLTGIAKQLHCWTNISPGTNETFTFTVQNGVAGTLSALSPSLTCNYSGATTSCVDNTDAPTITGTNTSSTPQAWDIKVALTGTGSAPAATYAHCSFILQVTH